MEGSLVYPSAVNGPGSTPTSRHKCSACYKQYKKKDHLIEHMKTSYHSVHQPKCGVCQKHCKSFESLREHLTGPLHKRDCASIFSEQGCNICLKVFNSAISLSVHQETCCLSAPLPLETAKLPFTEVRIDEGGETEPSNGSKAVAMDCEMVGCGSDGSLDLCARVCLVDEDENLVFHAYVQPELSVTDYRFEVTGLTEDSFQDAMPLTEVRDKIVAILYNEEAIGRLRLDGGKARLLVGHELEQDLKCLKMNYPDHLRRDTAKYRPLMKTNLVSHSLKYLTQAYLGYGIQSGVHNPYEDCVSAMRLYKRMRAQDHKGESAVDASPVSHCARNFFSAFDSWRPKELEEKTPEELYEISTSDYHCWCLDLRRPSRQNGVLWRAW